LSFLLLHVYIPAGRPEKFGLAGPRADLKGNVEEFQKSRFFLMACFWL